MFPQGDCHVSGKDGRRDLRLSQCKCCAIVGCQCIHMRHLDVTDARLFIWADSGQSYVRITLLGRLCATCAKIACHKCSACCLCSMICSKNVEQDDVTVCSTAGRVLVLHC